MLSQREQDFITYWEQHRLEKRKWVRNLSVGLPFGVAIVGAIFANLLSGWYSRAQMEFFSENRSLILILLLASVGIVVFISIFAARHRWEMNEQQYRELLQQKNKL